MGPLIEDGKVFALECIFGELLQGVRTQREIQFISEYWGNFYGDTAVDGTTAAYPCGYAFFGADRLLFGSDYPFGVEDGEAYIRDNLAGVRAMNLPPEEMEKILGNNAQKLLKID